MDIAWIGHAAFRLRGRDSAVVTDPCPSSTGFRLNRPQADVVTVSTPAPAHSWWEGVAVDALRVLRRPGEYEIGGVLLTGISTPLAAPAGAAGKGEPPERNTAFVITIDEIVVAHLGDLGGLPGTDQIEELSRAHVALVPVGGHGHLDAALAAKVVSALEPRLVIPMLYRVGSEKEELDPLEPFLKEMGAKMPAELDNHINLTPGNLPEHTTVHVLAPRGD